MKKPEMVRGSPVDQSEIVANGLKIMRILTAERDFALQIVDGYDVLVYDVLDLLEAHSGSGIIKAEGKDVIGNLSKFSVLSDDFKLRCKTLLIDLTTGPSRTP